MPTINVNHINLFYEWRGNPAGPPLVFVNGLLTDTSSWNAHLPHFVERYHCLVYDCRGQGQSDKPDVVYETPDHAADLAALVAALGIERAAFVGLSNGGAAVLDFAADHPERVRALVVSGAYAAVDTILRVKLTSWVRAMDAGGSPLGFDVATPWVWGGGFLENNYTALLPFREKGVNLPVAPARNLILGAMIHDVRDKLGQIAAPALVVVGEDDILTPPKLSQYIVAQVPGAELAIMPDLGHAAALEDPAQFCQRVLDFLARIEGGNDAVH
jgi:3-oxoadipate enol-lactonase